MSWWSVTVSRLGLDSNNRLIGIDLRIHVVNRQVGRVDARLKNSIGLLGQQYLK